MWLLHHGTHACMAIDSFKNRCSCNCAANWLTPIRVGAGTRRNSCCRSFQFPYTGTKPLHPGSKSGDW